MMFKLEKDQKDYMISRIQSYFHNERDEEIGNLGAQFLLDFVIKEFGPYFYNQGVDDAITMLNQKFTFIEEEIEALKIYS